MSKNNNILEVKGINAAKIFRGQQVAVFISGVEAYSKLRPGEVIIDDGQNQVAGQLNAKYVGSLFSLVRDFGRESVYTSGQMFDPTMIFDALDDAGQPIDPRTLYTAVTLSIPPASA